VQRRAGSILGTRSCNLTTACTPLASACSGPAFGENGCEAAAVVAGHALLLQWPTIALWCQCRCCRRGCCCAALTTWPAHSIHPQPRALHESPISCHSIFKIGMTETDGDTLGVGGRAGPCLRVMHASTKVLIWRAACSHYYLASAAPSTCVPSGVLEQAERGCWGSRGRRLPTWLAVALT